MIRTEMWYAQIEKEALATTWICEKFAQYIVGKRIYIETDHQPFVPPLGMKHLDSLLPRILRFRLRLMLFDFRIPHTPGKLMYSADTLSRAPVSSSEKNVLASENELESLVVEITASLPVCSTLISCCKSQLTDNLDLQMELKPYWNNRSELTVHH